ncbi:MAG: hypothetical protein IMY71_14420 [Bacteroidetes bacterium]|nr:hypothetical protein [Bacteroidota bacterium]
MKSKISFYSGLIIITILGYLIFFTSCVKFDEEEEQDTYFIVEVDSIDLTDTITTADTLFISFYGTVGNNSCYSFSHFYPQTNEDTINVEVWGKLAPGENCDSGLVYLEGEQLNIINFDEGTYFVHVKQPDGSLLTDSLAVIPVVSR